MGLTNSIIPVLFGSPLTLYIYFIIIAVNRETSLTNKIEIVLFQRNFLKRTKKNKQFKIVRTKLFFPEWTIFSTDLERTIVFYELFFGADFFLKTKENVKPFFYWTNYFHGQTILLNQRFYWTNDFTKWLFSEKTNKIDGKLTIIMGTNEIK